MVGADPGPQFTHPDEYVDTIVSFVREFVAAHASPV
jgi:hypothetical protein